jgi:starvation-inducible DNA-binding protein
MFTAELSLFSSSSQLSIEARARMIDALNGALADGIDLYTQLKLAHWNVKGPNFAALHPLFETLAGEAAARNDELAERGVALGGIALGTARQVAKATRLPEFLVRETDQTRLLELLVERIDVALGGLRAARDVASRSEDGDSEDLLTAQITALEKSAWFLRASLSA